MRVRLKTYEALIDKATVPGGSQFFYDTVGSKDKELRLYEGHFHDLLNDIRKEKNNGGH